MRNDFPDGVLQFLLLDRENRPLSERLLFCYDEDRQPQVTATQDKPRYGRREKVSLTLDFKDAGGNPLTGDFSVSVTDNRIVASRRPNDIRTSLLLESELRGYVEDPAFYFDEREPARRQAADALMLTQGWRRYDIPAVLLGEYAEPSEPHGNRSGRFGAHPQDRHLPQTEFQGLPGFGPDSAVRAFCGFRGGRCVPFRAERIRLSRQYALCAARPKGRTAGPTLNLSSTRRIIPVPITSCRSQTGLHVCGTITTTCHSLPTV